ncbi:hypothetical protein [Streptomyces sp. NPDC015414]|uniref:hypothetical protein n=1 Tax=Streptomyces sp. NPDC015414 TaxID=3364957 RepID=UPI0036F605F5
MADLDRLNKDDVESSLDEHTSEELALQASMRNMTCLQSYGASPGRRTCIDADPLSCMGDRRSLSLGELIFIARRTAVDTASGTGLQMG